MINHSVCIHSANDVLFRMELEGHTSEQNKHRIDDAATSPTFHLRNEIKRVNKMVNSVSFGNYLQVARMQRYSSMRDDFSLLEIFTQRHTLTRT